MTSFEDKISLMIPAYLRGELVEADRLAVEELAAKNPSIAADIEFQRGLRESLKPNEDAFEPGELGWARLSKAIEQEMPSQEQLVTSRPKFWKYAAAILAVTAIGQAGVLGAIAFESDENPQYKTVLETTTYGSSAKVEFSPNVTASQLTEILFSVEASIVAGPSSLGLYEIQFKSKSSCMEGLQVFKIQKNVVETRSTCE